MPSAPITRQMKSPERQRIEARRDVGLDDFGALSVGVDSRGCGTAARLQRRRANGFIGRR